MVWDTSTVVKQRPKGDDMSVNAIQPYGIVVVWPLGTRWMWVISFTLRPPYYHGRILRYAFINSLDGFQSRSERTGEEIFFFTYGKSDYDSSSQARSPVTIPVKLPWLPLKHIIYHHHHHHHHHHLVCRVSGLTTCSSPINSLEVIPGVDLRFVSNMVHIT